METPIFAGLSDYEVRQLVGHLVALQDARVHRLLRVETDDGRNAWYTEKERRDDIGSYLDDIGSARVLAAATSAAALRNNVYATGLSDELRHVLAIVSINSMSRTIPPALLAELVHVGHWPLEQAIRYADQQPFAPLRAESFALLSRFGAGRTKLECLERALTAARAITARPDWRLRAFGQIAALAPRPFTLQVLEEAIGTLREIGRIEVDENSAALLSAVPDDSWPEFESRLAGFPFTIEKPLRPGQEDLGGRPVPWTYGVRQFTLVVPRFSAPLQASLMTAARQTKESVLKGMVLASCSHGRDDLLSEVEDMVRAIPELRLRAELAASVTDSDARRHMLQQIVAEAEAEPDAATRAGALVGVAPVLHGARFHDLLTEAVAACKLVANPLERSYLLRFLIPALPDDMIGDIITQVDALEESENWGRVANALAPRLARVDLLHLLRRAQRIDDTADIVRALMAFAASAEPTLTADIASQIHSLMTGLSGATWYRCLDFIVEHLSLEQFESDLSAAADLEDAALRANAIRRMAESAIDDARLAAVARLDDPEFHVRALRTRAAYADADRRGDLLFAAWKTAAGIADLRRRLELAVMLYNEAGAADPTWAQALMATIQTSNWTPAEKADGIAALVPFVSDSEREAAIKDVLDRVADIMTEQKPRIERIVPHLRPLQHIVGEYNPHAALSAIAPHLSEPHWDAALRIIRDVREIFYREQALLTLAKSSPKVVSLESGYFDVAKTFNWLSPWARVHCMVIPLIQDESLRRRVVEFLFEQVPRLPIDRISQQDNSLLTCLAPYLEGEELEVVIETAARIADPWARDATLAELVERVPSSRSVSVAMTIETPMWRARAFRNLCARPLPPAEQAAVWESVKQLGAHPELLPIAAQLPEEQRTAVIEARIQSLLANRGWAAPMEPLVADYLTSAPLAGLHRMWTEAAPRLERRSRREFLHRLGTLTPFVVRLGGRASLGHVSGAVMDVARWWP